MPSFEGTWNTTRYRTATPDTPEQIVLTITLDTTAGSLDGQYARSGPDARMFGTLDATNFVWSASVDETGSTGDIGQAVFFISTDGNTIHGAWTSAQTGPGPQPWFGSRV